MDDEEKETRYRVINNDTIRGVVKSFSSYNDMKGYYDMIIGLSEGMLKNDVSKDLAELSRPCQIGVELAMIAVFADFVRLNIEVVMDVVRNLDIYEGSKQQVIEKLDINEDKFNKKLESLEIEGVPGIEDRTSQMSMEDWFEVAKQNSDRFFDNIDVKIANEEDEDE